MNAATIKEREGLAVVLSVLGGGYLGADGGDMVYLYDVDGDETHCWQSTEWALDPEIVMEAIFHYAEETIETLEPLPHRDEWPMPRSIWKHHSGRRYKVVMLANMDTTQPDRYPVHVVYVGVANGKAWTKTLTNFYKTMEPVDG